MCKGKVSRYNIYICPGCDALYCEKCAKVVEGMENACWVCEAPIDETKPVNIPEKEKGDLINAVDIKKEKK